MMFKFSLEACTAPLISFIFIFGEVEVSSKVGKSFTRWEARTVIAGGSSLRKCKMSKSVLFGRGKIKMKSKLKKSRRLYFLVCNLFRLKGGWYEQEKIFYHCCEMIRRGRRWEGDKKVALSRVNAPRIPTITCDLKLENIKICNNMQICTVLSFCRLLTGRASMCSFRSAWPDA